jgi:hypothetical protein
VTAGVLVLVRELRGTVCRCGKPKSAGFSFCGVCYHSLPGDVQKRLYNRIDGSGYEQAYEEAVIILRQKGRF